MNNAPTGNHVTQPNILPSDIGAPMLDASVVICAHNPRPDYLTRVLSALRRQTLPLHQWELILVDNASRVALASTWDLSWHPFARHVREGELGLSWARRRGIRESTASLIIFVDDDNVLDDDYLAKAVDVGQQWPALGTWGSGSIRGELEVELPASLQKHRSWLPVRAIAAPYWSNLASHEDAMPIGAGLCVRREVAVGYCGHCDRSSLQIIGRQGNALTAYEEIEISLVSCRMGLGVGTFPGLGLTHLIPKHRLTEEYFVRFVEGTCLSELLCKYKWNHSVPQSHFSLKTVLSVLKAFVGYRGVDRAMRLAYIRALAKANRAIRADQRQSHRLEVDDHRVEQNLA